MRYHAFEMGLRSKARCDEVYDYEPFAMGSMEVTTLGLNAMVIGYKTALCLLV